MSDGRFCSAAGCPYTKGAALAGNRGIALIRKRLRFPHARHAFTQGWCKTMITAFAAVVQVRKDRKFQCIYACPCQRLFTIEPPVFLTALFCRNTYAAASRSCAVRGIRFFRFCSPPPCQKSSAAFQRFFKYLKDRRNTGGLLPDRSVLKSGPAFHFSSAALANSSTAS